MKYAVVIEEGPDSFGAYVPDLPGCSVVGETREEVVQLIQEAIDLHLQSLKEHGDEIPPPASSVEFFGMRKESEQSVMEKLANQRKPRHDF
jgi:predicted RNase H-like HicB family nuclease